MIFASVLGAMVQKGLFTTEVDLNNLLDFGVYRIVSNDTILNAPDNNDKYSLYAFSTSDNHDTFFYGFQLCVPYNQDLFYVRRFSKISLTNPIGFGGWKQIQFV